MEAALSGAPYETPSYHDESPVFSLPSSIFPQPSNILSEHKSKVSEREKFESFMKFLTCQNAWKEIFEIPHALNILEISCNDIVEYIVAKEKSNDVTEAIMKNDEIKDNMKVAMLNKLTEMKVVVIQSPHQMLFGMTARIDNMKQDELLNKLSSYIFDGQVASNYQTDIGNIFHIFAAQHTDYRACEMSEHILRSLVHFGCDMFALNKNRLTPIDIALENKNHRTASLFIGLAREKIDFPEKHPPINFPEKNCLTVVPESAKNIHSSLSYVTFFVSIGLVIAFTKRIM